MTVAGNYKHGKTNWEISAKYRGQIRKKNLAAGLRVSSPIQCPESFIKFPGWSVICFLHRVAHTFLEGKRSNSKQYLDH